MPIKFPPWHWTHRYDVSSKGLYVITVYTMDGLAMEFTQAQASTGHDLLQFVAQRLELDETRLFGFRYELTQQKGYRHLLLNKPVRQQLDKHATGAFLLFSVLFYVEQPQLQPKETIRHQYYLQLRNDLSRGLLRPTVKQAIKLSIYALQADFGDFVSEERTREVWKKCHPLSLEQFPGAEDMANLAFHDDILCGYQHLSCLSSVNAQWYFLDQSRQCINYGLEMFDSADHQTFIGVSKRGISLWWRGRQSTSSLSGNGGADWSFPSDANSSGDNSQSLTDPNSSNVHFTAASNKPPRSQSSNSTGSAEGNVDGNQQASMTCLHLKWEDIKDFAYTRKIFTIQQIRRSKPMQVVMVNHHESKYLWKYCIEVHKFHVEHLTIYGPTIVSNSSLPQPPEMIRGIPTPKLSEHHHHHHHPSPNFFGSKSLTEIQKAESLTTERAATLGRSSEEHSSHQQHRAPRPLSTLILNTNDSTLGQNYNAIGQSSSNTISHASPVSKPSNTHAMHSTLHGTRSNTNLRTSDAGNLNNPMNVMYKSRLPPSIAENNNAVVSPTGQRFMIMNYGEQMQRSGLSPNEMELSVRPSDMPLPTILGVDSTGVEESFYDNLHHQQHRHYIPVAPHSQHGTSVTTESPLKEILPVRGLPPRAPSTVGNSGTPGQTQRSPGVRGTPSGSSAAVLSPLSNNTFGSKSIPVHTLESASWVSSNDRRLSPQSGRMMRSPSPTPSIQSPHIYNVESFVTSNDNENESNIPHSSLHFIPTSAYSVPITLNVPSVQKETSHYTQEQHHLQQQQPNESLEFYSNNTSSLGRSTQPDWSLIKNANSQRDLQGSAQTEKLTDLLTLTKMQKTPLSHRLLSEYQNNNMTNTSNHGINSPSSSAITTVTSSGYLMSPSRQHHYVNDEMGANWSLTSSGHYHLQHHPQGTIIHHSTDAGGKPSGYAGAITISPSRPSNTNNSHGDDSSSANSNATFCVNSSHEDEILDGDTSTCGTGVNGEFSISSNAIESASNTSSRLTGIGYSGNTSGMMAASWNGGQSNVRLPTMHSSGSSGGGTDVQMNGTLPGLRHRHTKSHVIPTYPSAVGMSNAVPLYRGENPSSSTTRMIASDNNQTRCPSVSRGHSFTLCDNSSLKTVNNVKKGLSVTTSLNDYQSTGSLTMVKHKSPHSFNGSSNEESHSKPLSFMNRIQRLFKRNHSSTNIYDPTDIQKTFKSMDNLPGQVSRKTSGDQQLRHRSVPTLNEIDLYADPTQLGLMFGRKLTPLLLADAVPWLKLTDELAAQVDRWDCRKRQEENLLSKLGLHSMPSIDPQGALPIAEELVRVFSRLPQRSERHSCQIGQLGTHVHRNGGINCIPYDYNRVRLCTNEEWNPLSKSQGSSIQSDYINAAHVKLQLQVGGKISRQWFIVAPALLSRVDQQILLWSMIWQQRINVIIILSPKDGLDPRIFPLTSNQRLFGPEILVEHEWSREDASGVSTRYCFHLTPSMQCVADNSLEGARGSRTVYLFHYHSCIDASASQSQSPDISSSMYSLASKSSAEYGCIPLDPVKFLEFLDEATTLHRNIASPREEGTVPLGLLSCATGWLDHGVILLCITMRWMLDQNVSMSSSHLLGLLRREGYMRVISNVEQYSFVLYCILYHLQRLRLI